MVMAKLDVYPQENEIRFICLSLHNDQLKIDQRPWFKIDYGWGLKGHRKPWSYSAYSIDFLEAQKMVVIFLLGTYYMSSMH